MDRDNLMLILRELQVGIETALEGKNATYNNDHLAALDEWANLIACAIHKIEKN